jgi:hypothetical protein
MDIFGSSHVYAIRAHWEKEDGTRMNNKERIKNDRAFFWFKASSPLYVYFIAFWL